MLCSGQSCSFWDSFACSCFEFFHNGHVPSDKPNKGCKVGFRRGVNGWKKLLRSEKLRSCTINNAKHAKIFEKRSFDWTVNDLISQFCVWKSFTQTCSKRKWPTEVSGQSKRTFYHSGREHNQTNQSWLWWRFFFSALAVGCTTSLGIMIGHYNDCHWVFIQSTILRLKFVSSHFSITLFCGAFSFALYLRFSFPSFWGTAPAFLKTSIFGIFPPVLVSF